MPDYLSRLKIQGRTSDNTMNALKIVNWNNNPLFIVGNDGVVKIGEKLFVDGTDEEKMLSGNVDLKLSVDGAIVTKEILVTINSERWPDYVFDKDYKLPTISELENYILLNKSLPEIPTSVETERFGINLGEMQALLLKKIEELTLYIIELKKENDSMNERLKKIEKHEEK